MVSFAMGWLGRVWIRSDSRPARLQSPLGPRSVRAASAGRPVALRRSGTPCVEQVNEAELASRSRSEPAERLIRFRQDQVAVVGHLFDGLYGTASERWPIRAATAAARRAVPLPPRLRSPAPPAACPSHGPGWAAAARSRVG